MGRIITYARVYDARGERPVRDLPKEAPAEERASAYACAAHAFEAVQDAEMSSPRGDAAVPICDLITAAYARAALAAVRNRPGAEAVWLRMAISYVRKEIKRRANAKRSI